MTGVVIVVQQESLKERPRIHKYVQVLRRHGIDCEVWKFGSVANELPGIRVRNLLSSRIRKGPAVIRYLAWMAIVAISAFRERRKAHFYAVGFDSAFPLCFVLPPETRLLFDNIDNVSLSYRWRFGLKRVFAALERFVARRAEIHVVPSRARWSGNENNLRIVANTPSSEMLDEARRIAAAKGWVRPKELTVYVNGWLSPSRGIATLVSALKNARDRGTVVRVLVAGRPACEEATELIGMDQVEYVGMLSNAEALALYFRSSLAFTYYDPSITINQVAESQKWTDCWATGTAFIVNSGVQTVAPFVRSQACFVERYDDVNGLAELFCKLELGSGQIETVAANMSEMTFKFWDVAMSSVTREWLGIVGDEDHQ